MELGWGDDGVVVSCKVVWVKNGISSFVGDVVDDGLESVEICRVERAGKASGDWRHALHQECDTEGVHTLAHEIVHRGGAWPSIVGTQNSRPFRLSKLGGALVHSKVLEFGSVAARSTTGRRRA